VVRDGSINPCAGSSGSFSTARLGKMDGGHRLPGLTRFSTGCVPGA
jgi:hypothetical protein